MSHRNPPVLVDGPAPVEQKKDNHEDVAHEAVGGDELHGNFLLVECLLPITNPTEGNVSLEPARLDVNASELPSPGSPVTYVSR